MSEDRVYTIAEYHALLDTTGSRLLPTTPRPTVGHGSPAGAEGRHGPAGTRGHALQPALLPPGAAMGTQLPLRIGSEKQARYEHWSKIRQRVQFQRQYVYEKLMSLWEEGPLLGLPLTIQIVRIAPRKLDDDNLVYALSATRDGISDWLCGTYCKGEDRQPGLLWQYDQRKVAPGFYAVEICIQRPKC